MGIGHGQTSGRDNGGAWQQARKLRLIWCGHVEGREATFYVFVDVNIIGLHQDLQFLSATMIRSFPRMRSSSSAEDDSATCYFFHGCARKARTEPPRQQRYHHSHVAFA